MAGYIGSKASVVSSGAERKKTFAITTTTTALTGLVYTPTKVHVFHNGVRLVDGTDFTATNSTSITLTVAAESGDQVVVVSYASFQVADAYTQTEADAEFVAKAGDTMTGPLSVTGTVTADYLNITAADNAITAKLANTDGANYLQVTNGTANGYFGTTATDTVAMLSIGAHPLTFGTDGGAEAMRIDSSQRVLKGYTSNVPTAGHNAALQVVGQGTADYHGATISAVGFSNNSNGAYFNLGSGRSNTAGTYTVVANNDTVGQINFTAADGINMSSRAAHITAHIDGAPGGNDTPGRIAFYTTSDGASNPTERMRINNAGLVEVGGGTYSGTARLQLSAPINQPTLRQSGSRFSKTEIGVGGSGSFNRCILTFTTGSGSDTVIVESDFTGYNAQWLNSKLGRYSNQAAVVMYHGANNSGTNITWTQNSNATSHTITIVTNTIHPVVKFVITAGGLSNSVTNVAAAWSNV